MDNNCIILFWHDLCLSVRQRERMVKWLSGISYRIELSAFQNTRNHVGVYVIGIHSVQFTYQTAFQLDITEKLGESFDSFVIREHNQDRTGSS